MRQSSVLVCAAATSVMLAGSILAEQDARFTKANQEYAAGEFKEAINDYEAVVKAGEWKANLFYDLGNAYFRIGDFGHAILNYERALALEPRHPEAQANLQIARDEARALELRPDRLQRYLRFATVKQYTIGAAVAFWIGVFSIAGSFLGRRRSPGLTTIATVALCASALLAGAVFALEIAAKEGGRAIVTGQDVQARVATADNANTVLTLAPGSEVTVLQERGQWLYARLPNNLNGWIPATSVQRVRL